MKKFLAILLTAMLVLGATSALAEISYPLEDAKPITYWLTLNSNVAAGSKSLNETPYAAGLIERTGVEVEFIHPATGQQTEQFNLMIASGKMPDIVEFNWVTGYTGGPSNAIANGLIVELNDYLEEFAPDYLAFLQEHPDIDMMVKTDDGQYYGFTMFIIDEQMMTSYGPFLRQDWLEELGLEVPTTIDEWTTVLTAFKEEKGAEVPFNFNENRTLNDMFYGGLFVGAFGTNISYYVDEGQVLYGPAQPQYKDFLAKMNEWYDAGLIDASFATADSAERDANMLSGRTGATVGWGSAHLGSLKRAFAEVDENADLVGVTYPTLNEGERPMFGQKRFPMDMPTTVAINAKSENIEQIIKFLNYGYTEEGYFYNNFGIEGTSYDLVDGYPQMKDDILNPAEGSIGQAWTQYARAPYSGPFRQSPMYFEQYLNLPGLQDAVALWAATDALDHMLPPVSISLEDGKTYNKISADMDSYAFEWTVQAITGAVSLDDFEDFVATLEDIGLEEATRIQQEAYERYLAR